MRFIQALSFYIFKQTDFQLADAKRKDDEPMVRKARYSSLLQVQFQPLPPPDSCPPNEDNEGEITDRKDEVARGNCSLSRLVFVEISST